MDTPDSVSCVEPRPVVIVSPTHIAPHIEPHHHRGSLSQPARKAFLPPDGLHEDIHQNDDEGNNGYLLKGKGKSCSEPGKNGTYRGIKLRGIKVCHACPQAAGNAEYQQKQSYDGAFLHRISKGKQIPSHPQKPSGFLAGAYQDGGKKSPGSPLFRPEMMSAADGYHTPPCRL